MAGRVLKTFFTPNTYGFLKKIVYGVPWPLRDLVFPKYRSRLEPLELACLVNSIESTKETGGTVCEIGCGWGYTSVFLLEHMRCTANPAPVILIDTFRGFSESSMRYEVMYRGKKRSEMDRFRHGSPAILKNTLHRLGYKGFTVIAGDCQEVDWEAIGPIAVASLDISLYLPTKHTLDKLWPHIVPGGAVLVADCKEGGIEDGSLQAYAEFIASHALPFVRVGSRGGLLRKSG